MSDNNQTVENVNFSNAQYATDPGSDSRFVAVNDNLRIDEVVMGRDGLLKGFVYHAPHALTLAGALAICRNDEALFLDIFNSKVANMCYARAGSRLRNRLPQDIGEGEKVKSWLNRHKDDIEEQKLSDPVLFSLEDAYTFAPGERELTPAGILRQINKLTVEANKLLAAGKAADAVAKFGEVSTLLERFKAATAAAAAAAEAGIDEGASE